jgi:hypothetical protein
LRIVAVSLRYRVVLAKDWIPPGMIPVPPMPRSRLVACPQAADVWFSAPECQPHVCTDVAATKPSAAANPNVAGLAKSSIDRPLFYRSVGAGFIGGLTGLPGSWLTGDDCIWKRGRLTNEYYRCYRALLAKTGGVLPEN